ncbi:mechanosensitive ion channel domain-containing protein [Sediminicoccus sp. BL-A-41-H5]|uniref:mechanosensitive ion channel domain-containing protein n=1 Tax=Sediminicoccus sp. BL-A-41-H5 TaxID=3421106 RepID=UPI003D665A24
MLLRALPLLLLLLAPLAQAQTAAPAAPRPAAAQTPAPAPAATPPAAATPATPPAAAAPAAAAPTPPAAPPPELAALLDILRDEARRGALIRALEATTGAPAAPEAAAPTPEEVISAPADIVVGIASRIGQFLIHAWATLSAAAELGLIRDWFERLATDERLQGQVWALTWKLALVLLAGMATERGLRWLMRRPNAWLESRGMAVQGRMQGLRRLPYMLGHLGLDLVPILGFGAAALAIIGTFAIWPSNRLVMEAVTFAYMAARAVMAAGRLVFAPGLTRLRLIRCDDETAAYATLWIRRLALTGVTFYATAEVAMLFGLPQGAYESIWRLGLLVLSLLVAQIVLQNRAAVAALLDAPDLAAGDVPTRSRAFMRAARSRLAEAWHIVVILWLLAAWTVWALEIERGFERLAEASVATIAIIIGAKLLDEGMRRLLDRLFRISADLSTRYPGLEERANRYLPALRTLISAVITAVGLVLLLEVWGLNSLSWFGSGRWGGRLISGITGIGITLIVALVIWEGANAWIQRYLARLPKDGSAARSARVRTLLPMLRTALGALLLVIVGLTLLTEIGINVAPLLAGAGVLGLAVGFGSQTLVRDVITGIFLLLEDAVAVGDTITVGGLSGTVEELSIRSIRLRAVDGSVHIVPFSAVTTVTNQTRDFGYAVLDLALDYTADTDAAVMMLRQVGESMREDEAWAPQLLAPLEVLGVDKMTDAGVILRARVMTPPARRWAVGRELNRRVKQHCDAAGIPLYAAMKAAAQPVTPAATAR